MLIVSPTEDRGVAAAAATAAIAAVAAVTSTYTQTTYTVTSTVVTTVPGRTTTELGKDHPHTLLRHFLHATQLTKY